CLAEHKAYKHSNRSGMERPVSITPVLLALYFIASFCVLKVQSASSNTVFHKVSITGASCSAVETPTSGLKALLECAVLCAQNSACLSFIYNGTDCVISNRNDCSTVSSTQMFIK
ncbi:hypothetical protein BOX15_Mlig009230g1, partial [Macrostomum lignano]